MNEMKKNREEGRKTEMRGDTQIGREKDRDVGERQRGGEVDREGGGGQKGREKEKGREEERSTEMRAAKKRRKT
jgi:hypothetical protein